MKRNGIIWSLLLGWLDEVDSDTSERHTGIHIREQAEKKNKRLLFITDTVEVL